MDRNEIDDEWELVLCHRDRVLALVHEHAAEGGKQLRFDRAQLIDAYTETRNYRALATRFGVSVGAIHEALNRLVRFARQVEHRTLLKDIGVSCRCVVLVGVSTRERAEELSDQLNELGFEARVEELD